MKRLFVQRYVARSIKPEAATAEPAIDVGARIEDGVEAANTEFRDDRFTAAIDRKSDDKAVFTVAYVVRAVSPGKYVLPQAYVEDMYNPSRYGRTNTGAIEVKAAK